MTTYLTNTDNAIIEIGTIVIALTGAVITYIVAPYIKSKTTTEQYKNIKDWVGFAVKAAEQIFSKPGTGDKKKQYVIDFLMSKGIKMTTEELDILIEAAVQELNQSKSAVLVTT